MFLIARILLIVAVLVGFYSIALLIYMGWPATGWLFCILGFVRYGRKGYVFLTTLGSARWANRDDLRKAGMLDAKVGIFLGRLQ